MILEYKERVLLCQLNNIVVRENSTISNFHLDVVDVYSVSSRNFDNSRIQIDFFFISRSFSFNSEVTLRDSFEIFGVAVLIGEDPDIYVFLVGR